MKEVYQKAEMIINNFESYDIIVTSGDDEPIKLPRVPAD